MLWRFDFARFVSKQHTSSIATNLSFLTNTVSVISLLIVQQVFWNQLDQRKVWIGHFHTLTCSVKSYIKSNSDAMCTDLILRLLDNCLAYVIEFDYSIYKKYKVWSQLFPPQ